jgi:hypothetical protein
MFHIPQVVLFCTYLFICVQVLIGVGKLLRLYDLGRKKLLRKCENKHIPHMVVDIKTIGERIIVSDVQVWASSFLLVILICCNQCWGSVTFWCGSGSADPYL